MAGRVEAAATENRAIVEAVVREDPDAAEQAMHEHLSNARDAALSLLLPAPGERRFYAQEKAEALFRTRPSG
ncbi:MAG: FCD domain-containing protein, partial [Gaiellaceae bacterium]